MPDIDNFKLRLPCVCGARLGHVATKNGQDRVFCNACGKYQYNAPKTETGRATRTVTTTHSAIKPKKRSRIIDRANQRCERCGKPGSLSATGLHVGHIVSVSDGHRHGLSDDVINSDENLIAECDECNLGHGKEALPLRLFVALLSSRFQ